MQRHVSEVPVGDGRVRCKVVITDTTPTAANSHESRIRQFDLLRALGEAPHLTACGPEPFQTCKWHHDGSKWVIEFEAIVKMVAA